MARVRPYVRPDSQTTPRRQAPPSHPRWLGEPGAAISMPELVRMSFEADVVVAGAGHNSLVTAAYLAKAGLRCLVLEGRATVGGNTNSEELTLPGFLHDTCSTISETTCLPVRTAPPWSSIIRTSA